MNRAYAINDFTYLGARVKALDAERVAAIQGCACAAGADGNVNHRDGCALHPGLPPATPPVPSKFSGIYHSVKRDEPGCNRAIAR